MKSELVSLRGHMLAMQGDVHKIQRVLRRDDDRLERMEKRLQIGEPAEPRRPYDPES